MANATNETAIPNGCMVENAPGCTPFSPPAPPARPPLGPSSPSDLQVKDWQTSMFLVGIIGLSISVLCVISFCATAQFFKGTLKNSCLSCCLAMICVSVVVGIICFTIPVTVYRNLIESNSIEIPDSSAVSWMARDGFVLFVFLAIFPVVTCCCTCWKYGEVEEKEKAALKEEEQKKKQDGKKADPLLDDLFVVREPSGKTSISSNAYHIASMERVARVVLAQNKPLPFSHP